MLAVSLTQDAMLMFPKVFADAVKCSECGKITTLKVNCSYPIELNDSKFRAEPELNDKTNLLKNEYQKNVSVAKTHLDILRAMLDDIEITLRSSPGKEPAVSRLEDNLIADLIDRCVEDADKIKMFAIDKNRASSLEIDYDEARNTYEGLKNVMLKYESLLASAIEDAEAYEYRGIGADVKKNQAREKQSFLSSATKFWTRDKTMKHAGGSSSQMSHSAFEKNKIASEMPSSINKADEIIRPPAAVDAEIKPPDIDYKLKGDPSKSVEATVATDIGGVFKAPVILHISSPEAAAAFDATQLKELLNVSGLHIVDGTIAPSYTSEAFSELLDNKDSPNGTKSIHIHLSPNSFSRQKTDVSLSSREKFTGISKESSNTNKETVKDVSTLINTNSSPSSQFQTPPPPPPAPPPPPSFLRGDPASSSPRTPPALPFLDGIRKSSQQRLSRMEVEHQPQPSSALSSLIEEIINASDIASSNKNKVIQNIQNSFEDEEDELMRICKEYPRLVQKHALNPQLMYEIACIWEENCLDNLRPMEKTKFMRPITNYEMPRCTSTAEAKQIASNKMKSILKARREEEQVQRQKSLRDDMQSELRKKVSERADQLRTEDANEEIKALTVGKIKRKSKK